MLQAQFLAEGGIRNKAQEPVSRLWSASVLSLDTIILYICSTIENEELYLCSIVAAKEGMRLEDALVANMHKE